eukprot:2558602-Pleurochrysis_carterae.AAC.1
MHMLDMSAAARKVPLSLAREGIALLLTVDLYRRVVACGRRASRRHGTATGSRPLERQLEGETI